MTQFADYQAQDPHGELFAADCCDPAKSGCVQGLLFWQTLPREYQRCWPHLRFMAMRTQGQSSSESDSERHFSRAARDISFGHCP